VIRLLLFVVPFGIWGNLKFIFRYYITSHPFSRRFQEEKKWLNLRKLKLKKKIPNTPSNLKCTVLYVNMLCYVSCYKILLLCSYIFSGVVTWAEVCICAWDIVAVIDSLIAGFWTSASRSIECRWVNYGTIWKWLNLTDFVYVVGTWMTQFAALKQHSVIYYVHRLRSNVVTI
jgi:hypothetical protein